MPRLSAPQAGPGDTDGDTDGPGVANPPPSSCTLSTVPSGCGHKAMSIQSSWPVLRTASVSTRAKTWRSAAIRPQQRRRGCLGDAPVAPPGTERRCDGRDGIGQQSPDINQLLTQDARRQGGEGVILQLVGQPLQLCRNRRHAGRALMQFHPRPLQEVSRGGCQAVHMPLQRHADATQLVGGQAQQAGGCPFGSLRGFTHPPCGVEGPDAAPTLLAHI
jgi:hypothetical protein